MMNRAQHLDGGVAASGGNPAYHLGGGGAGGDARIHNDHTLFFHVVEMGTAQLEVIVRGRLFVFIRRYGLGDPIIHLEQMFITRDFRFLRNYVYSRRRLTVLICVILIWTACLATSWISALIIAILFGTEALLWQWGLRYAATADSEQSGGLPRLFFTELNRKSRDQLAVRVFWYSTFEYRLVIVTAAVWLTLILDTVFTSTKPERATDFFALVTVTLLTPMIFGLTRRLMRRKQIFDQIATEACLLLDPSSKVLATIDRQYRGPISDPLELRRADLGNLVGHLSDAARIIDAQQVRGIVPHPVSTLLRAASQYVRKFLSSERSLNASIPDDILDVLRSVAMILVIPGEPVSRQALLKNVKPFDGDGTPAVDLEARPPKRLAIAANRVTAAIAGIQTPLVNLATIAVIVGALTLFILHRLNVIDTLHFMP